MNIVAMATLIIALAFVANCNGDYTDQYEPEVEPEMKIVSKRETSASTTDVQDKYKFGFGGIGYGAAGHYGGGVYAYPYGHGSYGHGHYGHGHYGHEGYGYGYGLGHGGYYWGRR